MLYVILLFDLKFRLTNSWYLLNLKPSAVRFLDGDSNDFRAQPEFGDLTEYLAGSSPILFFWDVHLVDRRLSFSTIWKQHWKQDDTHGLHDSSMRQDQQPQSHIDILQNAIHEQLPMEQHRAPWRWPSWSPSLVDPYTTSAAKDLSRIK